MGIIFLGVKDSTLPAAAGKAYVSPEAFRSNIEAILDAGTKAGVRRWLVITPPPVIEPPDKKGARSTANTQKYVDALSSLARARGAAFLDIFSQWPKTAGWDARYFLPDKLHLSADGNARLFSDVMAAVRVRWFFGGVGRGLGVLSLRPFVCVSNNPRPGLHNELSQISHKPPPHAHTSNQNPPTPPQAQLPDMDPATMAWQFPPMDAIDREDPGPAFAAMASG